MWIKAPGFKQEEQGCTVVMAASQRILILPMCVGFAWEFALGSRTTAKACIIERGIRSCCSK
ncbi:hypothetical protein I7I48_03712 [Histoplasma ohiense]|nr:hypothetical protein I7I48_03712 [Histoplasma ohiense (nom. inval.)]